MVSGLTAPPLYLSANSSSSLLDIRSSSACARCRLASSPSAADGSVLVPPAQLLTARRWWWASMLFCRMAVSQNTTCGLGEGQRR